MARVTLLALLASGCFYTEVINVGPEARIERVDPAAAVHVGGSVRLTALTSVDDDGDPLSYHWEAVACAACPAILFDDWEVDVPVPSHEPVRVSLVATDAHGAQGSATLQLQAANQDTDVDLVPQGAENPDGTYTVTRPIVFAAAGSDPDGDAVVLSFELHPPGAANPATYRFERVDATSYRLVPDVPGVWEVAVTGDDGYGGATTRTSRVTVSDDVPPCIAATSPAWSADGRVILSRADGPRRFSVDAVRDDLDPFPGSEGIHFAWATASDGGFIPVDGHDLGDLVIDPQAMRPGELLRVRVEIADRVVRPLPCAEEQAACSLTSSTCYQRLTWTVEAR